MKTPYFFEGDDVVKRLGSSGIVAGAADRSGSVDIAREGILSFEETNCNFYYYCSFGGVWIEVAAASDRLSVLTQVILVFLLELKRLSCREW